MSADGLRAKILALAEREFGRSYMPSHLRYVENIWDAAIEAVLDQIDEERNPTAYGACGCADAVRAMKAGL